MTAERTPKILVVDDDPRLRDLLRRYLGENGFQVFVSENGQAMNRLWVREHFDALILDLMMPGEDGLQILRRLRAAKDMTPVIMLTARGEDVDRIVGLELGADDYVSKPCPPRELAARLNAILRRTANNPSSVAPVVAGPITINPSQRTVLANGVPLELTGTEFTLLEVLARKVGQPVPKDEIYQKVLGRNMQRYDRAIDVHVSAIRHKLVAQLDKTVAIESIRGVGYQLVIRTPID